MKTQRKDEEVRTESNKRLTNLTDKGSVEIPESLLPYAPWWRFVCLLCGPLFWGALVVLALIVGAIAALTWYGVTPTGWWRVLGVLGLIVLWLAVVVAFAGGILRSWK